MSIPAIPSTLFVISSVVIIFLMSLMLEFGNHRDLIPILFVASVGFCVVFKTKFMISLEIFDVSSDWKIIGSFSVLALASLQIHTFEVLFGFSKAAYDAAHLAGFRLGHSIAGLI